MTNIDTILQPLRIPPGWTVDYNIFTHYDPSAETRQFFFGSTLFAASHAHDQLGIELCFEPEGDPNGYYVLDLFEYSTYGKKQPSKVPRERLIRSIRTRSRHEVVAAIEEFMSSRKCMLGPVRE